jgi:Uncharacterised protein family (UPF0236)
MNDNSKPTAGNCPATSESLSDSVLNAADDLIQFCQRAEVAFGQFEQDLAARLAVLGCCLTQLFLTARRERLDLQPFLEDGRFRPGDDYAERTLKTRFGKVTYGRQYLQSCRGGHGIFPLDIVLGLTWDQLSPWVMQWVARLATRMSFKAAKMVCQAVLNWAPATETIEQVVLGMGRDAAAFMKQLKAPSEEGQVLIIEVDGKCPPTATAAELAKRRGPRQPRHLKDCTCGCQRHRGKAKRQARGSKKRRKKGDKSKNGKEVIVVVMYTLKRGEDGKLHGPRNKKIYATFAGSKAAAAWARAEASKRGFAPDTQETVQILMDGAKRLRTALEEKFPQAIFTLDVWHVVERLWAVGRHYHKEGSDELAEFVDELKALLYEKTAETLAERLQQLLQQVPHNGPGTKGRRQILKKTINYIKRRLDMMHYQEWLEKDLVISTGQVEGTVRQLVGERFDCAGMRWLKGKAEALLHLRCIELNGDWQKFVNWFQRKNQGHLRKGKRRRVLSDKPLTIKKAA